MFPTRAIQPGAIHLSVIFLTCFQRWVCVLFFCQKRRFSGAAFDGVFRPFIRLRRVRAVGEGERQSDAVAEDCPRGWSALTDRGRRCGSAAVPGQGPFAVCYRWKSTFTEVETSPGSIQPRGKITVSRPVLTSYHSRPHFGGLPWRPPQGNSAARRSSQRNPIIRIIDSLSIRNGNAIHLLKRSPQMCRRHLPEFLCIHVKHGRRDTEVSKQCGT